jgi:hypothetical protein
MDCQVSQELAAAITPSQGKVCPCDEEAPELWFRLNKAQFITARIRSQKIKHGKTLANLPKQVLRDILDTFDACN